LTRIVEYKYHSIEQAQAAFSNLWNVKFIQPEPGELEIRFQSTAVGRCHVYQSSSNIPMICTGSRTPDVVTISPINAMCERGKYRGKQLKADQVLVMDPGGDAFQQIAANHQQTAVSIPVELLDRIARAEYGFEEGSHWKWRVATPTHRQSTILCQTIDSIVSGQAHDFIGANAEVRLAEMIFAMVRDRSQASPEPSRHLNRRVIVRNAEEFIRADLCNPPSILELCEFTGAGRRELFYAFDELIGLSPIAYLKAARLQEARKRIMASDQQHCVQLVARNLNFSHLGQFSIDYAKHFGESPSQTCKRFHGAS
jgi:AraC family transcriptional regulator, ethanolamine operon transcriptional activator